MSVRSAASCRGESLNIKWDCMFSSEIASRYQCLPVEGRSKNKSHLPKCQFKLFVFVVIIFLFILAIQRSLYGVFPVLVMEDKSTSHLSKVDLKLVWDFNSLIIRVRNCLTHITVSPWVSPLRQRTGCAKPTDSNLKTTHPPLHIIWGKPLFMYNNFICIKGDICDSISPLHKLYN